MVDELSGAPEDVVLIMSMVPRGHKTVIHQSPNFEAALYEICDYCVNIQGRRSYDIWATLSARLREKHDIHIEPATVKTWCMKYVLPNITIPRSYVMRAIVEKGRHLDTVGEYMELRDELVEAYNKAVADMYLHQKDESGRLVRTGSNGTEVAALAKARLEATKHLMDELERYGIVPARKSRGDVARVDITVDVGSAMRGLGGRVTDPPLDASWSPAASPPAQGTSTPAPPDGSA